MKHNLSKIMRSAWRFYRKLTISFSEALKLAWSNSKALAAGKAARAEEVHSWAGWKAMGYEVRHGSKAAFRITLADPTTKNGKRTVSYFGASQVEVTA